MHTHRKRALPHNGKKASAEATKDIESEGNHHQCALTELSSATQKSGGFLAEDGNDTSPDLPVLTTFENIRLIYTRNTCATCAAPLDRSQEDLGIHEPEIYCTRSTAAGHLPLICIDSCGLKFHSVNELKKHSDIHRHDAYQCAVPTCQQAVRHTTISWHLKQIHQHIKWNCAQCGDPFENPSYLDNHGWVRNHVAYKCQYPECGSTASGIGELRRHQLIHKKKAPRHPCPHCRTYRGNDGFKRKDHLNQHIEGYHKINVIKNYHCSQGRCWNTHKGLDAFVQHCLDVHHSLPFVCKVAGCDRVGMNGFDDDKRFKLHQKNDHPSPFQCAHPGCDRIGSNGWLRKRDMIKHVQRLHAENEQLVNSL